MGSLIAYDQELQPVPSQFTAADSAWRLLAAGCVPGPDGRVRAAVFSVGALEQHVLAEMDVPRDGRWFVLPAGVGFLPAVGTEPAALLGTTLAVDGASVGRYHLAAVGADRLVPELQDEDDATTVSLSSTGGDLDGDALPDVVALMTFGESEEGSIGFRVFLALGTTHRGRRLTGISGPLAGRSPAVFARDFDQDGVDDLLIAAPDRFMVARMGP
jgi:hypothetical protein